MGVSAFTRREMRRDGNVTGAEYAAFSLLHVDADGKAIQRPAVSPPVFPHDAKMSMSCSAMASAGPSHTTRPGLPYEVSYWPRSSNRPLCYLKI